MIRKLLLDKVKTYKDIKIHADNSADELYIKYFEHLFKLDCSYEIQRPLFTINGVKEILNSFYKENKIKTLDTSSNKDSINIINKLILDYGLDNLDFDIGYNSLIELLRNTKTNEESDKVGVKISNDLTINNEIFFITDFQSGCFYTEYKDDGILPDEALKELNLNTSYEKTALDRRKKLCFLKHSNIAVLSRVKYHQSDSIFDSQFLVEKNKDLLLNDPISISYNCDDFNSTRSGIRPDLQSFTTDALNLISIIKLDKNFIFDKHDILNSYDNSFNNNNFEKNFLQDKIPSKNGTYSITNLEKYPLCPFKYLLDELDLKEDEDTKLTHFGILLHAILESIDISYIKKNKSIDELIKLGEQRYVDGGGDLSQFKFLPLYEYHFKFILEKLIGEYKKAKIDNLLSEVRFTFSIAPDIKINGAIDKIILTTFNEKKFYTLIDYKTGSETFEKELCFLGVSTQLPIYAYALDNLISSGQFKGISNEYEFGGMGLQHIYFKDLKNNLYKPNYINNNYEQLTGKNLEHFYITSLSFSGVFSNNEDYKKSICNYVLSDKESEYNVDDLETILPIKYNSNYTGLVQDFNFIPKINNGSSDYVVMRTTIDRKTYGCFEEYSKFNDEIIEKLKEIVDNIKSNKFDISPRTRGYSTSDKALPCNFCDYKDICYRKKTDIFSNKDAVIDHYKLGENYDK